MTRLSAVWDRLARAVKLPGSLVVNDVPLAVSRFTLEEVAAEFGIDLEDDAPLPPTWPPNDGQERCCECGALTCWCVCARSTTENGASKLSDHDNRDQHAAEHADGVAPNGSCAICGRAVCDQLQGEVDRLTAALADQREAMQRVRRLGEFWRDMEDVLGGMELGSQAILTSADSVRMFHARGSEIIDALDGAK